MSHEPLRKRLVRALEVVKCPHATVSWACRGCAADAVLPLLAADRERLARVEALCDRHPHGAISVGALRAALSETETGEL